MSHATDPTVLWTQTHQDKASDTYFGELLKRGIGVNASLDVADCVTFQKSTCGGRALTNQQQQDHQQKQSVSVLTPDTSCPATCEDTYFPKYVLRRASEIKTRAEYNTCRRRITFPTILTSLKNARIDRPVPTSGPGPLVGTGRSVRAFL
jgi:hypothetical protein